MSGVRNWQAVAAWSRNSAGPMTGRRRPDIQEDLDPMKMHDAYKHERDEFLRDVMDIALSGGIDYWCAVLSQVVSIVRDPSDAFAKVKPWDDPEVYRIDIEVIQRGLDAIVSGSAEVNREIAAAIIEAQVNLDSTDIDADAADCIVQVGLFGEVVYG